MLECGTVVKLKNNDAVVRIVRGSACGGCHACGMSENKPHIDIAVENVHNAAVGDTVELDIGGGSVLRASIICYLIPLVPAFLFAILAALLKLPDFAQIAVFVAGLVAGLLLVRYIDRKLAKRSVVGPKMTQVVKKSGA